MYIIKIETEIKKKITHIFSINIIQKIFTSVIISFFLINLNIHRYAK